MTGRRHRQRQSNTEECPHPNLQQGRSAIAKALKTAAVVVGIAALAVATYGASIGPTAAAAAGSAGIGALSVSAAATALAAAAAVTSLAATALTKPPATSISGNQTQFTASLDQGVPWLVGQTGSAGCAVHDITWDNGGTVPNEMQTFYGVWSGDRCQELLQTQIDRNPINFAGDVGFGGWMWLRTQMGASPETEALTATGFHPYVPGWTSASKLSGMAAFAWTLKFDPTGAVYPGGVVPQKMDELKGALAWDPRLDSTYPGGSGSHRPDDPSTWAWTENPYLLALKWARGIWQNGKRVLGIGMALAVIDVPSAVTAANIADANGWKVGGVVYSTDPKWDVLKKICAAGSGEPIRVGGKLYFMADAPRVSLATITNEDIIGKPTIPGGTRMKDRINGVIPTYREPAQNWQLVPAAKVTVDAYVTADSRPRTKAMTWELVQQVDQVAELATYAICNAREIDGIVLPMRIRWIGYKPGDAVTVMASILAMDNQLVVFRKRHIDPGSAAVTFNCRTETTEKHAFALGKTTTPPPMPALATTDRTGLLIPGVDAQVYGTANRLKFSQFEAGTTGWVKRFESPVGIVTEALHTGLTQGKPYLKIGATATASGQIVSIGTADGSAFPVKPGERLAISLGTEVQGAGGLRQVAIFFRDKDGALVAPDGGNGVASATGTCTFGTPLAGFKAVPTGAVTAVIEVYLTSSAAGFMSLALTDPMVSAVGGSQIVQPGFTPGRNAHDGATVGAPPGTIVGGSTADQVVADIASSLTSAAASSMTGATWRAATDLFLKNPDGTNIRQDLDAIGVTVGNVNVFVALMKTVGDDGYGQFVLAVDSGGRIVGVRGASDLTGLGNLDFLGSRFRFIDDSGAHSTYVAVYEDGRWKMHALEVDTLKINTAMQPVRVVAADYITGSYGSTTGFASPRSAALTAAIVVPTAGWVEVTAKFVMGQETGDGPFSASIAMGGTDDGYSLIGDGLSQANNFTQASFYCSAGGTYSIQLMIAAYSGLDIRERNMFIKFFPFTA